MCDGVSKLFRYLCSQGNSVGVQAIGDAFVTVSMTLHFMKAAKTYITRCQFTSSVAQETGATESENTGRIHVLPCDTM